MRISYVILTMLAALALPGAGQAATITTDVVFTATPMVSVMGTTPPADPVIGSFHITFDPAQFYFDATSISVNSLNINVDHGVVFSYNPLVSILNVGGSDQGSGAFFWATNDFSLGMLYDGSTFTLHSLTYSQAGVFDTFDYRPVVPIPGALPLLTTGLAGLCLIAWRKRFVSAADA
jgi:hypothetical protein